MKKQSSEQLTQVLEFPVPPEKEGRDKLTKEFHKSAENYLFTVGRLFEGNNKDLLNYHIGVLDNAFLDIFSGKIRTKADEVKVKNIMKDILYFRDNQEKPGMLKACLKHIIEQINYYATSDEIVDITGLLDRLSEEIMDSLRKRA